MSNPPFVSVHIISKENTYLGREFINGCFTSLVDSYYPNEIILVDNGSSDFIFDTYNLWIPKFKDFDCPLKMIKSDAKDFSSIRNLCIEKTNPKADFMHWIDTDEVYYPEDLDVLKNYAMSEVPDISQIWTSFYHFMVHPNQIQVNPDNMKYGKVPTNDDARSSKDNVFAFHPKIAWNKEEKVHEHVCNKKKGIAVASGAEYLHYGYCRQIYLTTLKWLRYAELEFGNINCYKKETITIDDKTNKEVSNAFLGKEGYTGKTVDHMRNWRNPNTIIKDRRRYCMPYPCHLTHKSHLPEGSIKLLNGCKDEQDWNAYIDKLDPPEFWYWWQDQYKKCGNWTDTLDLALEKAKKENIVN